MNCLILVPTFRQKNRKSRWENSPKPRIEAGISLRLVREVGKKRIYGALLLLLLLGHGLFSTVCEAAEKPFFADGKTAWTVQISPAGDPTLEFARDELQRALKLISGAEFPDAEFPDRESVSPSASNVSETSASAELSPPENVIRIEAVQALAQTPDLICVEKRAGGLFLCGGSPRSALYAVYDFLQKELGARWFWPGADGEFLPQKSSWTLPGTLKRSFTPSIKYRGFHMCGDWYGVQDFHLWMARNQLNIHRHGNHRFPDQERGFYRMYSSHNVYPPEVLIDEHPEYFALRNGNRLKSQVCLSSRECVRVVADKLTKELEGKEGIDILSLFLPDNQEYCQCEECSKKSVSTAFFDFYSDLTDILKERFPNLKFATLAYQGYLDVPANPLRNTEFVEIATHGRCNIHTYCGCERNAKEMKRFLDWKATGIPIGNYAYEYDIFASETLFLPLFSIMADVVKVNRDLNSVVLIPEVSLSPRTGPEEKVGSIANRISQYVTARLMVEPDADWKEILRDFCAYAFGPAAEPMYEYLLALDAQWIKIESHRGILGNPAGFADQFLTDEIQALAVQKFRKAEECLRTASTQDLTRERAALEREKVLFALWKRFVESGERFDAPLVSDPLAADSGTRIPGLSARVCWTKEGITLKDFQLPVELALSTGLSGETWFFRLEKDGTKKQWNVSDVGVRDDSWNADWNAVLNPSVRQMTIPFAALPTLPPTTKIIWQFRLSEGELSYPAPDAPPAGFTFSAAAKTGRKVAYWPGSITRDAPFHANLVSTFRENGWELQLTKTPEEFLNLPAEAFWLKNPNFEKKMPPECWERLRKEVEDGAVAVFLSYSSLPLDKFFNDSSFAVKVHGIPGRITLEERRSNFILPGNWSKAPYDLTRALKNRITPAYCLELAEPDRWHILATMPKSSQELDARLTYLAFRRYGKGGVLLMAADPRFSYPGILENIQTNIEDFPEK